MWGVSRGVQVVITILWCDFLTKEITKTASISLEMQCEKGKMCATTTLSNPI